MSSHLYPYSIKKARFCMGIMWITSLGFVRSYPLWMIYLWTITLYMNSKTILFGGSGFLGPIILEKYPNIISVGRTPPPSYVKNMHIPINMDHLEALDSLEFDKVIFVIG